MVLPDFLVRAEAYGKIGIYPMTIPVVVFLLAGGGSRDAAMRAVESGRVLEIAVTASERIALARQIAPGAPPLLSFRYFEGRLRHGYGDLNLVLDDAGH